MKAVLIRSLLAALLVSFFAIAEEPGSSRDTATQELLKEVHALRMVLERNNQIGPRIQITLARMQWQEERVRNGTRQLQDIRDRIADIETKRAESADRIKQFETQQVQAADPNARKQMDFDLSEMKAQMERAATLEEQLRAKEGEANSALLSEQAKWNEANDQLTSIERMLAQPQP
jgi:chromosome segregation ATPase